MGRQSRGKRERGAKRVGSSSAPGREGGRARPRARGGASGGVAEGEGPGDLPRGVVRPSRNARWRALSLILLHVLIAVHIVHWSVAKTTLTPLEPSEIVETFGKGLVNAGAILFVVATLSTAIFGRFFCGWGCHIVALQDLCSWLLKRAGLEPRPFRSRLLVFMPLLAALMMFVVPTLTRMWMGGAQPDLQWHLTTDDMWARFPAWPIALATFFVCGFGIVYLLGNKAFCTYACPYGGVFGLVERLAPLRVRVTDACDGCGHCTATCTSNVRVHEEVRLHEMVVDPGCMKCADCVSVCPKDALHISFGKPAIGLPPPRAEPRLLPPAYSWPEEIALAVSFVVATAILRKLYDGVPFLLSLALAAISSHALLTAWRLATRPHVRYGRFALTRAGQLTGGGRLFAVAIAVWIVFLGHSALVQYWSLSGTAGASAALTALDGVTDAEPAKRRALEEALARLERAERYGLVSVGNQLGLLGGGSARLGRHDEAQRYLRRAVEVAPAYAYAHVLLADYAERRGDTQARLSSLRAAVGADPEWPGAHENLLRALAETGELELARLELEALLHERPSSGPLRRSYGMLLANLGEPEAAVAETQRVIAAAPTDAVARFNLVLLLANQGRFAEAERACVPLRELRPDSADVARTCARVASARIQP